MAKSARQLKQLKLVITGNDSRLHTGIRAGNTLGKPCPELNPPPETFPNFGWRHGCDEGEFGVVPGLNGQECTCMYI
jgi:hypothetical protein